MNKREYEQKSDRLAKYRELLRSFDRRTEERKRWESRALGQSGSVLHYPVTRSGSGTDGDPVATAAAKAIELQEECAQLLETAWAERDRLCSCVALMPSARWRELLELLYVNGRSAEQLAKDLDRDAKTIRRWVETAMRELEQHSDFFAD